MGVTELIPGISGSTIAMILGIYEQFVGSINGLTTKNWKKSLAFLIPLGIGMGSAILLFSKVIKWLQEYHPQPLYFFFLA